MAKKTEIDSLDKRILRQLSENARVPFLEIARELGISGAAVHQRVQKLVEMGVISGSQYSRNPKGLGYLTCAFIGIQVNLISMGTHEQVFERIMQIPEIVECHHISGKYSLFIKIFTRNNEHLKQIIIEKIQSIPEVTATETFISLEEGFMRQIPV